MKKVGIAMVLFCLAVSMASAQTPADAAAVTMVLALEHAWNQAEERKDTKAMDALFDNAMVYVDYDGTFKTKAEFLARVKAGNAHPQQEVTESMTAYPFVNSVVVTGIYLATGVENGKSYTRRGRFVDTWVSKNGNWVCVASQATPILR